MSLRQPKAVYRRDYRPADYAIDAVELVFDLDEAATRVSSRLTVRRVGSDPQPLVLDAEDMDIATVRVDGTPIHPGKVERGAAHLTVHSLPATCTLEIDATVSPRDNTRLEGLYVSSGTFCTQCEAEGFRRITPFLDRPDVMARYRTTIRADKARCPVLLSNGNLVGERDLGEGRHEAVWEDPFPKPSYLFALVAGDLACVEDRFTTASGRGVALRIFVEHGCEDRARYAMESLQKAMRWDEEVFGREYDLDLFNVVAVSDFNMGAMENKSLNIFNSKYVLANPDTATDADYAAIESIVAHEYFHNWTGNRVTCRDWFQLSLKEGLTVFRDQEFSADMRSRAVQRIHDVRALRARQFPEDAGPLAHPVRPDSYIEINNFYTSTVYEKGAEVIRMMHRLLGRDGFRKGMDLYFERHDGQAVTCDDFVAAMEDATGTDLSQFRQWYSQSGTPEVTIGETYDSANGVYSLTLRQTTAPTPGQPEKAPMHIPMEIALIGADGRRLPLRLEGEAKAEGTARVLELRGAEQTFRFLDLPDRPVPSVNRGFSAPVRLRQAQGDGERAFLMAHDDDLFNRWEAAQQFAINQLIDRVEARRSGADHPADPIFISALDAMLADPELDKALLAQVLALPSEDYIAEQMAVVDVEAVHQAREALRRDIATALHRRLETLYRANGSNHPYAPDPAEAARRALRNAALWYLAALDGGAGHELVAGQYFSADNMTDSAAALAILCGLDTPARAEALADFEARHRDDPVVIDKWFAFQATSPLPDTLERVRALMDHPAFSMRNPNKVRALIGAFASGNLLRFHAADGSGYAFLAERILELDPINPQVAARLITPLGRWRRFADERRRLMRNELDRIANSSELSRDVYEMASKSLEG